MLYFLIGFMGSGKSYMSKKLSKELQVPFVDMDQEIEKQEGKTINEIFAQHGEDYFRELERNYLLNLNSKQSLIVATGGGVPYFFDNMEIMNAKGVTLYLNRSKSKILKQLMKGRHKRPLLHGKSMEEVAEFYDLKMKERAPYYEKSMIHVGDMDYVQVAQMIKSGWL